MDVTYNNVLESTRQYFQGVPPAATGVNHVGQHAGGGGNGLGMYNNVQQGGPPQANGPTHYYHQNHHQAVQQQRQAVGQQPTVHPSYMTNGNMGVPNKTHYNSTPQPSPSPQESLRIPSAAANKNMYNTHPQPSPSPQEQRLPVGNSNKSLYSPHPQPSPSPQEHARLPVGNSNKNMYSPHPQPSPSPQEHVRLPVGNSNKNMYSPHPQPSPSPQEHVRLPSMSPFNNLNYQNQLQQVRNRETPTAPSPLPPISQLKPPTSTPSPIPAASAASYQRQMNGGSSSRYGSSSGYYHPSLLQQQQDLLQQQQQLQQQLQQHQQDELKQQLQQQAFYASLSGSSQQRVPQANSAQSQRQTSNNQYTPSQTSNRSATSVNPGVNLSRTPVSAAAPPATGVKRESPLDLSVKTVRQSADSTAQMDHGNAEQGTTYYYFQQEGLRHAPSNSMNNKQPDDYPHAASLQPASTPKVDFSPNFSQHAQYLQSHQQQQYQQHQVHQQQHYHNQQQQQHHHQQQQQQHHQLLQQQQQHYHPQQQQQQQHHQPQPHHQPQLQQQQPQQHQRQQQLHNQMTQNQQVPSYQQSSVAHRQQQFYQQHSQSATHQQVDKTYPLPSVVKSAMGAGNGHGSHHPAGNQGVPGSSSNVNHSTAQYQVNQLGQSMAKSPYHQDARYSHNYLKRPPSVDQSKTSAPTAPKQPRADNWKATIDQQIEKRFNSYLSSKGMLNGDISKTSLPPTPAPTPTSYPMPASRNYTYDHHHVPNQQHHQVGYQGDKGTYFPPSSNTGNGAADKRILSILRNSLETKEARLQQLQQQQAKSPVTYTELTTRPPPHQQPMAQSRHSLPPFQGGTMDRVPSTFSRLSIPKAVDSIQESNKNSSYHYGANHSFHQPMAMQQHYSVQNQRHLSGPSKHQLEVVDITDEGDLKARLSSSKQSQHIMNSVSNAATPGAASPALPTSKSGEFDGLAAFLAARIRTKAELKQQPTSDQPPTPGSSSLASASLSSTNFRSPFNDLVKTPGPSSDLLSSSSKCSPWTSSPKLAKDQPPSAAFPRRRLFSKGEEEPPPAESEGPASGSFPPSSASIPPRASSSHRSSSETSVFDFRETDSEGETPTLERQAGRRPSVSSAPGAPPPPPPVTDVYFPPTPLEEELKPVDDETYEEWLGYVDELLSQLEKDRLKRLKASKKSSRGGRGGGRGAGLGDRQPSAAFDVKPVLPQPIAIKQEVTSDPEESCSSFAAPGLLASASSTTVKREPTESDVPPEKDVVVSQITPEGKTEFKERRGRGGARGGRGRGRGGGPGSRGGRGGRTKKTVFGDGSDFKTPGWEEELYKFKKSLRMPPRLINISRPPGWPKAPLSLPDLEAYPDSPCTNDSIETFPGKSKNEEKNDEDEKKKEEDKKSIAKSLGEDQSFLNRLMAKYTARKKKHKKESPVKVETKTEISTPELLPTPSLHGSKQDPSFLGFRKETIHEYRAEFLKTGAFTAEADLPPAILVNRTRTENKLFKERLTFKEVFGAERPASAPPPGTTTDDLRRRQRLRKNKQKETKKRMMVRAKKELQQTSGAAQGKNKTFRTFRRKLKSSGFDYIRKPKKKITGPKKDSDHPHKPRKKKIQPMSEEEIEEIMKSWTLNKGIGETVLHRASKNGLIDVVRYLLDKLENDPSPRDNAGYTPLHEACSRGHVAVAHLLLNYGASVEDSALGGVRPLHEAAENGFTKVVRLLLDYGADPLLATYSGATALSLAAADEESRLLMEQHIAHNGSVASSVQNDIASVPEDIGLDSFEIEESDFPLPTLYRLSGESRLDSWVLLHELVPHVNAKTKEALIKLLKPNSATVIRDMKLHDFFAKAHSRGIKSAPPTECPNVTPKLTLVKYTDEIKELLEVETTTIPR